MKKIAFGISCMTILLTAVSPICATDSTVTYTEDSSWVVTIPNKIEIKKDETTMQEIVATDINIKPQYRLRVRVSAGLTNGNVTLQRGDGTSIDVFVSTDAAGTSEVYPSTNIAQFEGQSTTPLGTGGKIYFAPVSKQNPNAAAGSYEGTMTFLLDMYKPTAIGS